MSMIWLPILLCVAALPFVYWACAGLFCIYLNRNPPWHSHRWCITCKLENFEKR